MRQSSGVGRQIPAETLVARDPWAFRRWAFEQVTGNVGRKTVLMALASMADTETGRCEAKHETLARWAEISRRSIIRHVEALRELGLVATRRQYRQDGSRRGDEFLLLAPWVAEWPDGESIANLSSQSDTVAQRDQSANGDRSKVTTETRSRSRLSQQERPLRNDHVGTNGSSSSTRLGWVGVPDEMRADAEALLKAKQKVNGRLVTEAEFEIAAAALAEFNRQAESDFGLGAHLVQLVMRVRERPSWDAAKHVRLVASAWRLRWWEKRNGASRRATPQVVYGNSKVFEMVAQDAKDEAAGKAVEIEADSPLKSARFSGGRSWDELTAREQQVARENFVIRGAQRGPDDARPVVASGNGLTAENF